MKEDKIIMFDSDEAANPIKITGWVSYNGYLFLDEQSARHDGCTHIKCRDCGVPTQKGYLICDDCREKADTARWLKLGEKEWDGKTMLYSKKYDEYFEDASSLEDFLENLEDRPSEERPSIKDLRLLICEKLTYRTIDPDDYYADDLAEDCDVDDEIIEAFEELNKKISSCKVPICWEPCEFRPTTASVLKELGGGVSK